MASYKNFSKNSRAEKDGSNNNLDSSRSNSVRKEEKIDIEAWRNFFSFYRYHVDRFAIECLKLKVFPFQRLILRAMARYNNSMLICCRGLGKSYIVAMFMICMAILYPGIKIGIVSGKGQQARNVIIQKIKGELSKNENVAREIKFPIKTSPDDCVVEFKNGSEIRAIVLGQNQQGDSARSWRFSIILVDEARLVKDDIIEEVLIPMTKTKRQNIIYLQDKFPDAPITEKGKMIFISSAYLKTCDLYKRFLHYYSAMTSGNKNYFVASLDYKVGCKSKLFDEEDILSERDKPTMTIDKFTYEYLGVFVGSSSESYYPYELTIRSRVLDDVELAQPKKSNCIYVITHDVAVSGEKNSDNACTHVIKLKQKPNGTYTKDVVYTKTMNGASLKQQRDFLRELIHIRFPNTNKLVIDAQSAGQGLLSLLAETWNYKMATGETIEFPPIVSDSDKEAMSMPGAVPLIRGVEAYNGFHNLFYPYMKSCFEDGTLRLTTDSSDSDELYKEDKISVEEQVVHVEHDILMQELSNIKQDNSDKSNAIVYTRIVKKKKRDRATSLMYGLSYIYELELEGKGNATRKSEDINDMLACVAY